jgi:hypothetical protein
MNNLRIKHLKNRSLLSSQRGLVGILLLVTITVVAVAAFSKNIWGEDSKNYQAKVNREALKQAKAALLDYLVVGSVTGGINDPFSTSDLGRLPCPDQTGDGTSEAPCGIGTAYKTAGYHSLGLLPWKTINSPIVRDASRQCLWYAVDGLYKSSPATYPVNADSFGSFSIVQPVKPTNPSLLSSLWPTGLLIGDTTTSGNVASRVVAVIVAPGPPGGSQAQTSVGSTTYACGLTQTVSGTPNAEASAPDFLKFYSTTISNQSLLPASGTPTANLALPSPTPLGALVTFVTADSGQEQLNDQITWITAEEVAKATTQRVAQLYANQITVYAKATGFYPWAASTPGGKCVKDLLQGFVPYSCEVASSTTTTTYNGSSPPSRCPATSSTPDCPELSFGSNNFYIDKDFWAGQAHYAVSKDCVAKTSNTRISGQDRPVYNNGPNGGNYSHPCNQSQDSDRINLGAGTNGPAAIILMRGRKLSNQTLCVAYDASTGAQKTATSNISNCLEDATNKSTVNTAFTSPKYYSSSTASNTFMYNTAPYRVPQPSTSNDYLVQLTLD